MTCQAWSSAKKCEFLGGAVCPLVCLSMWLSRATSHALQLQASPNGELGTLRAVPALNPGRKFKLNHCRFHSPLLPWDRTGRNLLSSDLSGKAALALWPLQLQDQFCQAFAQDHRANLREMQTIRIPQHFVLGVQQGSWIKECHPLIVQHGIVGKIGKHFLRLFQEYFSISAPELATAWRGRHGKCQCRHPNFMASNV